MITVATAIHIRVPDFVDTMRGPCIHSFITLIGSVSVTEDGHGNVTGLYLPSQNLPAMEESETEVLSETEAQVNEYLTGRRRSFDVPLSYGGSAFRVAVMEALLRIPYGEVRSYAEVAEDAGSPGAYRAVGTVCSGNPLPLLVPCHRVVPSTGGVGGYSGGSALKMRLLELERDG